MRDLVGHHRAAGAGVLGPAVHAGFEEGAVDDQLTAAVEQVEQARRALGPVELVLLLHGQPRHPPTLGGQRVTGAGQLLLLHEQLLGAQRSHSSGDTIGGVFIADSSRVLAVRSLGSAAGVGTGVAAGCRDRQPLEVVRPTVAVILDRIGGKTAVHEAHARLVAFGMQRDLHASWSRAGSDGPSPPSRT